MKRLLLIICSAALFLSNSSAEDFALRDGDTVAFLGDSITGARGYSKVIENYTLLRFPERKIRFVNVGQGGETAQGSLARLDEAVFARGATVLTVAYGINDIGWGTKADAKHKAEFLAALGSIIERCQAKGVRVFICSAAITAEAPDEAEHNFLQTMCDEGLAMAKAKGAGAIDVQRGMRAIQRRVLAANESKPDKTKHDSLHATDGIHLNDLGQMAMAVTILKGLGAPAEVSAATINAQNGTVALARDCDITALATRDAALTFTRHDHRLPLNLQPLWMLHGFFIPIGEELNRYDLTITNLTPGRYAVLAGGRRLGTWSAEQLAQGVNLASASAEPWEPGGPWQAQGQLLKTLTDLRDEIDWAGRDLKKFLTAHPAQADLATKTASIETALTALQRDLARPVPTDFIVRPAAAEAGK
ncbi:MAG: GDSL-type esterase/lipase family protein [Verrucomicrobiota bacterium]